MKSNKKYIVLILLHVLIGLLIYGFRDLSKVFFISTFVYFIFAIINSSHEKRPTKVLMACAYIVGSEVFLRMTGGNFLYEASKYIVIVFIFIGMLFDGIRNKAFPFFLYLLLLIPGIFVGGSSISYTTNFRKAMAFNLSGPVCLGLCALYCFDKRIKFKDLQKVLLFALLPLISMAVFLFVYTPNIRDIITGTYSNFQTSGGFGPNQVATVLGFAMFVITSRYFLTSKTMFIKILNLLILGIISFRGIVTFSRGGIFTGVIIIFAFLIIYYLSSKRDYKAKILNNVYLFVGILMVTWFVSSFQTRGLIDKRYSNEDSAGRKKSDISTGRRELISFELNEFIENPLFGIGVGRAKEIRFKKEGLAAASHNEFSRLLAEHGSFGLMAFMVIFILPLTYRVQNKRNIYFYSFYLFWFLTINHTSMRIAAPAFIYSLSLLNVVYDKPTRRRKRVRTKGSTLK